MRHVRMLGLCLLAALAVCAYAVASASALPEWGKCEAKAGGKYKDANCQEKAAKGKGAFEWLKATQVAAKRKSEGLNPNVGFEGESVGSGGVLQTYGRHCETEQALRVTRAKCKELGGHEISSYEEEGGEPVKIECEHEANKGEAVGKDSVENVDVVFTGCKLFGSLPCSNGPVEGEVQINPLKGTLGYINKAEKKVGVLLEPVAKKGEFVKFECGGLLETVVGVGNDKEGAEYTSSGCKGAKCTATPAEEKDGGYDGIISPIGPVNTSTTEFTQVYTVSPSGENVPSKFEGKHIELLEDYLYNPSKAPESYDWSAAGEEITNTNHSCKYGANGISNGREVEGGPCYEKINGQPTAESAEIKA